MQRKKGRNKHHLTPKSRNGKSTVNNLLLIDIDRHNEWHKIFGVETLEEVIKLLIRLKRAKENQA